MLKAFSKTLLVAFVLGACIPQNQSSTSFTLNEAPKIVYNKTEMPTRLLGKIIAGVGR